MTSQNQNNPGRGLSRRALLLVGGGAGAAVALSACSGSSSATTAASSTSSDQAASASASAAATTSASAVAGIGCTDAAGATAAASGNTRLSAGSAKVTFSSTGSGGAGNAAGTGQGTASGASSAAPGGTPPSPPSGSQPGGAAPSGAPSGAAGGSAPGGSAPGGTGSQSGGSQTLKGAYLVDGTTATITGGTWTSTTADQAVFLVVNGGSLTIKDAVIVKSGATASEDGANFYGTNAAVLVAGKGSKVVLENCRVTTAADGANALFATNQATLSASRVTVRTSKNSSRGLDATYQGQITASGLDIATTGAHCACVATDRGNGTVTVTGKNLFNSSGDGSPLLYSTGNIAVSGTTGTAKGAQTMVIEGKNQIEVTGCQFTTSGTEGMMIYQSFSGDASDDSATASHSTMTIKDSTITSSTSKPMVYVTNTTCVVDVSSSTLSHPSGSKLLDLEADRWGTSGSNGGKATVTFTTCGKLTGDLTAGSTSSATVKLAGGTTSSGKTSGKVTVTS